MSKNKSTRDVIESYFQVIIIFILVFIITYFFVGQLYEVTGDSMTPSYQNGEQLIAEKISIKLSNLQRGDVIIFRSPLDKNRLLVKRLIGFPGDKLQIMDGSVYINGEMLNEKYLSETTITEGKRILEENFEYKIPADSYVVMGDNREQSTDSREWGYIKTEYMIGRAILVYYPLKNLRFVESIKY
ncbi:signal peptidase I [Patescibacteria group bacterium]|nr:signal peptidase I [Patescibacteria group bacterium]